LIGTMPNEVTIGAVAVPGRSGTFGLTMRDGVIARLQPAYAGSEGVWLALPGLVNLHAHADRAFTVTDFRPRSFADALAAATEGRASFTAADVEARALRLFERSLGHGVTGIRTHTDVDPIVELRSIEGVLAAKQRMAGRIDIDVVAFSTSKNDLADPQAAARLERALAMGANLIGASLNASTDPERALGALLDLAERSGAAVDIHLDEHLEPHRMLSGMVAEAVLARGLQGRVTLSHLCVLGALNSKIAGEVIRKLTQAAIAVVALPETNLYLQDRAQQGGPIRRGVTLIRDLREAGLEVRLGTDNVRDWFFPFGDGDLLDTARCAAMAAHLDEPAELMAAVCDGRRSIKEGDPADLVLVRAASFDDALARRPAGRVVFKAGRQVAGPARA
jgi:cytosine deaminase